MIAAVAIIVWWTVTSSDSPSAADPSGLVAETADAETSPDGANASTPGFFEGAEVLAKIEQAAEPPPAEPGSELPPQPGEIPSTKGPGNYPKPGEPLRIPVGKPIPEIFPYQKERLHIQGLASTYDAASVPALASFLDHSDPLVREAARMALIQLSQPEAVPVLRAAASRAKDVTEAAALTEAAEFLELATSS